MLGRLVDAGNSVIVIEHNLDVIKTADWIVDMGPEGGTGGGTVVAEGTPEQVAEVEASHTGRFLRPRPGRQAGCPAGGQGGSQARPRYAPSAARLRQRLRQAPGGGRPLVGLGRAGASVSTVAGLAARSSIAEPQRGTTRTAEG